MKNYEKEKNKYSHIIILILLIILSLLIHLLIFGTFLKYGFKRRAKQFFASISTCLTTSEKKALQEKAEKKHAAIQRIFQTAKKHQKHKFEAMSKNGIKDTRPARLVAPKSNFGWVIFDPQHQQPEKLEIPNTKQGEIGLAQLSHVTETKPESREGQIQRPQQKKSELEHHVKKLEKSDELKPEEPKSSKKADNTAKIDILEKKVISEIGKGVTITQDNQSESVDEIKKRIEKIERLQKQIEAYAEKSKNLDKIESREIVQLEPGAGQEDAKQKDEPQIQQAQHEMTKEEEKNMILSSILRKDIADESRKSNSTQPSTGFVWGARGKNEIGKNIIKLTKGYIEKWHGESGTDLIDRDGDPNKRPSFEELKYISYESKINWCLQSSWKNNFSNNQTLHLTEGKAIIEFTIDEKGKILNSKMLQSSGYREVDSAIMKNLEFAAPFPPLPKHFGTKTYSTGRVITVYAHKFGL